LHLALKNEGTSDLRVCFDTTAFYDDVVRVCREAAAKSWGGMAKARYNTWITFNLDGKKHAKAVKEIARGLK
jgi:hypothetical protein